MSTLSIFIVTLSLSIIGVLSMCLVVGLTIFDIRKLKKLEKQIENQSIIINDQQYQELKNLKKKLTQLSNQANKLEIEKRKRLIYENESLIQTVRQNIELYLNVEPSIKKRINKLLRQESDLGKIDYMLKIFTLLINKKIIN
ncbi:MAG: hypothetical protein AB4063_17230 [Crocosphaera sp.]